MMHARRSACCTLIFLMVAATSVRAQTCFGTPPRGGIAVDHGNVNFGTTNGVTAAIAGDRFAFGAGFRSIDRGSNVSGTGADVRFALVFGGGGLQLCPGLGFEYGHDTYKASSGTLTSNSLGAWGGIGLGYEYRFKDDFSVTPFTGVRFNFRAVKYDFDAGAGSQVATTGDTISRAQMHYGLMARYKIVYLGFYADHALKDAPPILARWMLGITFPFRDEQK